MVPYTCWIYNAFYILNYVHNRYTVLYAYGTLHVLDMR